MPKVFYGLCERKGGLSKKGKIAVFMSYEEARKHADSLDTEWSDEGWNMTEEEAYVPDGTKAVYIVTPINYEYGDFTCSKCEKTFKPVVFATEEQADRMTEETRRACPRCPQLTVIKSKIQGSKAPRKPDTVYIVLTSNEFGREDDGCVSVFRSLPAAEKHQGEHALECELIEKEFPDIETTAYVVTAKYGGCSKDCKGCGTEWSAYENYRAEIYTPEDEEYAYKVPIWWKCNEEPCTMKFAVTETKIIEDAKRKGDAKKTKRRKARKEERESAKRRVQS